MPRTTDTNNDNFAKRYERVRFQLLTTPCCHTMLCWVNPRLPNYCPECGKAIWLCHHREHVVFTDDEATLRYKEPK